MNSNEIKKIGEIFETIGRKIQDNPSFLYKIDEFLNSKTIVAKEKSFDINKVNAIDLYQLIREKSELEMENILLDFTLKELREILKKYRFGSSSKLKSEMQIRNYILHQLTKRKTDVFHNMEKGTSLYESIPPLTEKPIMEEKNADSIIKPNE